MMVHVGRDGDHGGHYARDGSECSGAALGSSPSQACDRLQRVLHAPHLRLLPLPHVHRLPRGHYYHPNQHALS